MSRLSRARERLHMQFPAAANTEYRVDGGNSGNPPPASP